MAYSFVSSDRDQGFLLPPDMRDWLAEDDLVWTVLDAVDQMDLSAFRRSYRDDGRSRPAYDPAMMVALLLFAYCDGVRSSRRIEARCRRDVAFRVISANLRPDHATIARFRARHRDALGGVFTEVLRLCARAGLVRVGLVALDGTKLRGNARGRANRTREQIEAEITELARTAEDMLAEADRVDAVEDAEHGDRRGDEPPADLAKREARLARLREAKARMDAEDAAAQAGQDRRRADWQAAREAGQKVGRPPGARPPKRERPAKVNLVDPDSGIMKTGSNGYCQGYNGQVVVGAGQIILAAAISGCAADNPALHPMLTAAQDQLTAAGISQRIRGAVADSGYGGKSNLARRTNLTLLIATGSGRAKGDTKPAHNPHVAAMSRRVDSDIGRRLYARRAAMVEPVFGQIKNRLGAQLHHRGIPAVSTEWQLISTSHNLLKYWRAQTKPSR